MNFLKIRKSDGWSLGCLTMKPEDAHCNEDDHCQLVAIEDPAAFQAMRGAGYYRNGKFEPADPPVTLADIYAVRASEFRNTTDPMVTGGRDFDRDWKRYVRDLREITDGPKKGDKDYDIDRVLKRFPVRPTGVDVAADLRQRRAKETGK